MVATQFPGDSAVVLDEVPDPRPADGQVVLQVAYCGLCGSEKRQLERGTRHTAGHEVSGVVIESRSDSVPVGTRAVAYLSLFCGSCEYCVAGETNRCINMREMIGWSQHWPGGYAERMVVPARNIIPVADEIPLDHAVLLLDTIGTAMHAVRMGSEARRVLGTTQSREPRALVMGAGPLGLGAVASLAAIGRHAIYASDPIGYRREAASDLGAVALEPEAVNELPPLDLIIEAAGREQTLLAAIDHVAPGGCVVMLGENWQPWSFVPKPQNMIKDYSLIRSWYFPLSEFKANAELLRNEVILAEELISHRFELSELRQAFEVFLSGDSRKVLCGPGEL